MDNQTNSGEHKKIGPIVAILVIVLVLVVAALYLFASKINKQTVTPPVTSATPTQSTAATIESVQAVTNTADDVDSLQKDLETSTNGLDNQNF